MSNATKNMVVGSMVVSGIVALTAVLDMVIGHPFAGNMMLDIMLLIGAALILYMGYDAYQDLT